MRLLRRNSLMSLILLNFKKKRTFLRNFLRNKTRLSLKTSNFFLVFRFMKAIDVIDSVNDRLQAEGTVKSRHLLTNSKLNDYRKFLRPIPNKYPGKSIFNFSSRHVDMLFEAMKLIAKDGTKTVEAFKIAIANLENPEQTEMSI